MSSNKALKGGAVYGDDSDVSHISVLYRNNEATTQNVNGAGGAIYLRDSVLRLTPKKASDFTLDVSHVMQDNVVPGISAATAFPLNTLAFCCSNQDPSQGSHCCDKNSFLHSWKISVSASTEIASNAADVGGGLYLESSGLTNIDDESDDANFPLSPQVPADILLLHNE